ncbi:uncharacterized protein B0H64DRAFT_435993 [Chaetomium fimeti]|uniref:DUF7580 domain-containing protein n=1 Tax=Chaetomium fimeti TaxID=1854472 RepID=A0AAE0H6Y3_9PEZI|nr:hypothetical protein B0H64DRAFT_435993 [Chaetomium fimeti]
MDPVSLALGIAPLCLGALKGAKYAKSKIKLLKHHGREISRFRKRLRTQMSIFRDESHLLVQDAGIDPDLAAEMVEDQNHEHWTSPDLEFQIQNFLAKRYLGLKGVAEQIYSQVEALSRDLDVIEDSDHPSSKGKLAAKAHRAGQAVRLVSKYSDLEASLESLTDSVEEFRRLRKTARELQKPRQALSMRRKAMPRTYNLVARHSASFLESLSKTWSCRNSNGVHSAHTAKLFLETDVFDSCVNFTMILEYVAIAGNLKQQSLLFLRIRSEELSWVDIGLPAPIASPQPLEPPAKARRLTIADSPQSCPRTCTSPLARRHTSNEKLAHNLCQAKDVCHHVFECGKALHQSKEEGCIGYLVSTDNLTHQLMASHDRESTAIQTRPSPPASLASVIQHPNQQEIPVNEQVRLALRLSRSVLQYHSTSWWRQNWDLSDLSYFDIDDELSISLSTLHINAKLSSPEAAMSMQSVTTHIPAPPSHHDAQLLHGIRNVTLHSLGVALLQIGRWEVMDADDLVSVRKAAAKPSRLGPRYDELTAKCLYCDFGFGADLNKPQLQGAIYESVVHELEEMVALLEGGRK